MQVVHVVCSDGFAGVERYIANLSVSLAGTGVEVTVIGGSEPAMTAALAGTGVEWLAGNSMGQSLGALRSLPVPDIVNTHMSQADLIGFAYRYSRPGARKAHHVSTRHFAGPRGRNGVSQAAFSIVGWSITRQLAISEFVAQSIEGPADVVHSGVDVREAQKPRERFVLVAQRLEAEKDTETAVRAWALADARRHGWRLLVAGDGAERGFLERLADELGIRDSIEFLGFRSDIQDLLQRSALTIAPTPREGLGILVLEAMALGTPVIASAGGGHLETVGLASPRLLFPPRDAARAAILVDELVADAAGREEAGRALQELQRARFTLERQTEGTRALYERLLRA